MSDYRASTLLRIFNLVVTLRAQTDWVRYNGYMSTVAERLNSVNQNHKNRTRARRLSDVTVPYLRELLRKQNYCCAECARDISEQYELDHIYPMSLGGGHIIGNLQFLCRSCNRAKLDCVDFMPNLPEPWGFPEGSTDPAPWRPCYN